MDKLAGIPGTIRDDVKRLNWHRIDDHGGCKRYKAITPDGGMLVAMVGHEPAGKDEKLLWHISVSHRDKNGQPDRCPNWDEMKHAAYRLIQGDIPFMLIFPRRSAPYVDVYSTCLHLWEATEDVDL